MVPRVRCPTPDQESAGSRQPSSTKFSCPPWVSHSEQMQVLRFELSHGCKHQLPNKVRYLDLLMQQKSQLPSATQEGEHLPLLKL
jgi:hypothetical protein